MPWWSRAEEQRPERREARLARAIRRKRRGFFSPFGGYWTDRRDALTRLGKQRARGRLAQGEEELLRAWMRDGFVVLPGAVSEELVDTINAEVDAIWERRDESFQIELGGRYSGLEPELRDQPYKLLDLVVRQTAALEAALAPAVQRFLELVFESPPLLFQSLSFERGSRQPIHQDAAFVVLDSPMELAASWIALEDVRPGSGELEYYVGSHRLEGHVFPGGARSFDPERHDEELHREYLAGLHERASAAGLERRRFLPRKGDALIWSADLAHGGSAVADEALTRKSLVSHYCPADVRPYYFYQHPVPPPIRRVPGRGAYCSSYYPLP